MREADDRDCECLLVDDEIKSYSPKFKEAMLETVREGGIFGWAAATHQVP